VKARTVDGSWLVREVDGSRLRSEGTRSHLARSVVGPLGPGDRPLVHHPRIYIYGEAILHLGAFCLEVALKSIDLCGSDPHSPKL
jgi:hypothetical protein